MKYAIINCHNVRKSTILRYKEKYSLIILGIDPGYAIVGWGVIEYKGVTFRPVAFGAITTEAPTEKPSKKKTAMLVIMEVEPTAARASLPTKFPTTIISTVLYSIWNTFPSISGSENRMICFTIDPLVIFTLVVCRCRFLLNFVTG